MFQSRSVDKRHAVLTYDGYEDKYRVKDLSSVNGVSRGPGFSSYWFVVVAWDRDLPTASVRGVLI